MTKRKIAGAQLHDLYASRAREIGPLQAGPVHDITPPAISIAYGLADPTLFPVQELAAATADVLAESSDPALNYGPPSAALLEQLVARLRMQDIAATTEHLLLSYGSSQLLALLPQVLVDPGDVVLIEGPSFLGAVRRFELAGARIVTIPTDRQGMDIDALETELRTLARANIRPKLIYTIPTFHNPTGVTMPVERRERLVALGAQYGVLIVEDDAYGDLGFADDPPPALAALDSAGWVIRLGTFSKILAPGVRVGWAYGPPELLQRLSHFKPEGPTGPFLTHVIARYCADGRLERHIAELRQAYRQKCQVMLDAIAREFPRDVETIVPAGGFFVWCKLPADLRASALGPVAAAHGVAFLPGTQCYTNGQGDDAIRLAFSYHHVEILREGITRIGAAMQACRAGPRSAGKNG